MSGAPASTPISPPLAAPPRPRSSKARRRNFSASLFPSNANAAAPGLGSSLLRGRRRPVLLGLAFTAAAAAVFGVAWREDLSQAFRRLLVSAPVRSAESGSPAREPRKGEASARDRLQPGRQRRAARAEDPPRIPRDAGPRGARRCDPR